MVFGLWYLGIESATMIRLYERVPGFVCILHVNEATHEQNGDDMIHIVLLFLCNAQINNWW